MSWLTSHWDLKLVALVLAVALWTYTTGQVHVERTAAVTVTDQAVANLPERSRITAISPREFKVRLSVPSSRAGELPLDALEPRLALSPQATIERGQVFPITARSLGLPDDVRITAIEPDNVREITVSLDLETEADLPVEPPAVTGLPPGLEASLQLDLTLVRLRAPGAEVERMRAAKMRVRFEPVDLAGVDPMLARPRQERVVLTPSAAGFAVLRPVHATITVRPRPGQPRQVTVPVEVLGSRDLLRSVAVGIDQPRAVLVLRGPENQLAALKPDQDLTAYVRLRDDLAPGQPHELPVGVLAPPWLAVEPATARVTLVPLRAAAPEPAGAQP